MIRSTPSAHRSLSPVKVGLALIFAVIAADLLTSAAAIQSQGGSMSRMRPTAQATLVAYCIWGLLALVIVALGNRFPIAGTRRARHLALHAAAAPLCTVGHAAAFTMARRILGIGTPFEFAAALTMTLINAGTFGLIIYAVVLAVQSAVANAREVRERERRASQLETALTRAELEALRTQIHPHFLFNSLHAISSLMDDDISRSRQMMQTLSELLRASLQRPDAQEVPLRVELEFLQKYISLHQIRFGDRLRVSWDIDPRTVDVMLPMFLLQPLVENAIRHGISRRPGAGNIWISSMLDGKTMQVTVENDGIRLAQTATSAEGLGVSNTTERLARLYGEEHAFSLKDLPDGRVAATVRIPVPESEWSEQ